MYEAYGYSSQPYVEDIGNHYLHIVLVHINENGKKIKDKFERRRSKDISRSLEQKYGLHTAEKVSNEKNSEFTMIDVSQGNIKEQVENVVREG